MVKSDPRKDTKVSPQEIVNDVLQTLAMHKELTVGQAAEILDLAGRQLRAKLHEAMAQEMAKKVSDTFEPKSDIKIVKTLN